MSLLTVIGLVSGEGGGGGSMVDRAVGSSPLVLLFNEGDAVAVVGVAAAPFDFLANTCRKAIAPRLAELTGVVLSIWK